MRKLTSKQKADIARQKANLEKSRQLLKESKAMTVLVAAISLAKKKAPINLVFDQSVADGTLQANGIDPRTGRPIGQSKPAPSRATERRRDRFGRFI